MKKQNIKSHILDALASGGRKALTRAELAARHGLAKASRADVNAAIDELLAEGLALDTKKGIVSPRSRGMLAGTYEGTQRGFGFVAPDVPEGSQKPADVFIPAKATVGAMHGDRVLIKLRQGRGDDARPFGEVVRIVRRGADEVVGRIQQNGRGLVLVPDDARLCDHVRVRPGRQKPQVGDKASVRITEYPEDGEPPAGRVTRVFGPSTGIGPNYLATLYKSGLPLDFPDSALAQADEAKSASESDISRRRDLRDELIFTIDGAGAKDFDDAVSLGVNAAGNRVLGVHIADVGHYVTEGSPLDKSAFERGTSVYFADKVVPMLPEKLSNGLCSLMPDEDRLALTAELELDADGGVLDVRLCESVIRSKLRCVYEELNAVLGGAADPALREKYACVLPTVKQLERLYKQLNARRAARGALEIDTPECEIELDGDGRPTAIKRRERGLTERIIEECMILCNEAVARHMGERELPVLYRVHERPDPDRLLDLYRALELLGARLPKDGAPHDMLNECLRQFRGGPLERVTGIMLTRTLKKARYGARNLGHFGLASAEYCHFTSPIRRYPDLFTHRTLKESLRSDMGKKRRAALWDMARDAADQSNQTELRALQVERDIEQLFKVAFMADKVGQVFSGVVSAVTSFGFFVELPDTVEGLVRAASLDDDYYELDEQSMTLRGARHGRAFRPGDRLDVLLTRADIEARQIDFSPIDADRR